MPNISNLPNCVNFVKQPFTVNETRLVHLVIAHIQEPERKEMLLQKANGLELYPIEFQFAKLGIRDYNSIVELVHTISKKQMNYKEKQTGNVISLNVFPTVSTDRKDNKFYIDVHPKMLELFLNYGGDSGEGYTPVDRDILFSLNSRYSIRLYEILKAKIKIRNWEVSIKELREMLDLDDSSYPNWAYFRINILERAKSELEEKSNLRFNYEITEKEKKKVVKIKFTVKIQNDSVKDDAPQGNSQSDFSDNLRFDKKDSGNKQQNLFPEFPYKIFEPKDLSKGDLEYLDWRLLHEIKFYEIEKENLKRNFPAWQLFFLAEYISYVLNIKKETIKNPVEYFVQSLENNSKLCKFKFSRNSIFTGSARKFKNHGEN